MSSFYWAHHVWEDGEVAHWYVSRDFDTRVLEWLKQVYGRLELERKDVYYVYGGTLVVFYRDRVDVFGRACTEISAAFCPRSFSEEWMTRSSLRTTLERELLQAPCSLKTVVVRVPWWWRWEVWWREIMSRSRNPLLLLMVGGVGVSLGFLALVWILWDRGGESLACPEREYRYVETIQYWNTMIERASLHDTLAFWSPCEPERVLRTLGRFFDTFMRPLSREVWSDMDSASRYDREGFFAFYGKFLVQIPETQPPSYWQSIRPLYDKTATVKKTLDISMTEEDLHNVILHITHQTHIEKGLHVLVSRYNPCFYFTLFFRRFSSQSIENCRELELLAEPYPTLYEWLVRKGSGEGEGEQSGEGRGE